MPPTPHRWHSSSCSWMRPMSARMPAMHAATRLASAPFSARARAAASASRSASCDGQMKQGAARCGSAQAASGGNLPTSPATPPPSAPAAVRRSASGSLQSAARPAPAPPPMPAPDVGQQEAVTGQHTSSGRRQVARRQLRAAGRVGAGTHRERLLVLPAALLQLGDLVVLGVQGHLGQEDLLGGRAKAWQASGKQGQVRAGG